MSVSDAISTATPLHAELLLNPQQTRQATPQSDTPSKTEAVSDKGLDRGPDTIVELSPQATEAANASADTGSDTPPDTGKDEQAEQEPEKRPGADGEKSITGQALTEDEQEEVEQLKERDSEVRRHEQAHKAAAGPYAQGGPTFDFQRGSDGKQYAVGGEVQIDTTPIEDDPQATLRKMEVIRRAALSPAEPSSQDRAVAAQAAQTAQQARAELHSQEGQGSGETQAEEAGETTEATNAASSNTTDGHGDETTAPVGSRNEAETPRQRDGESATPPNGYTTPSPSASRTLDTFA
jgi:hypothetical protein